MPHLFTSFGLGALVAASSLAIVACGSSSSDAPPSPKTHDAGTTPVPVTGDDDAGITTPDANTPVTTDDASTDAGAVDAAVGFPADPTDGTPVRQTCTGNFGSALTTDHGRLDGILVAIVQPHTNSTCNGDTHVHLQMLVNGSVYDVATNLTTLFYTQDIALPIEAWSEGWHPSLSLDYPTLGIHSTQFTQPASEAALSAIVTTDLENANHISVFATGYGVDGIHDVHRKSGGNDGAILIDPLSPKAHGLFFRFDTDVF